MNNFIICKTIPSTNRPGKTEKMPCDLSGKVVSLHVADRMSHADAIDRAALLGAEYRPATILNGDGRFCIDLDACLLPDQTWSPLAIELCTRFAGCMTETSNSGTGLHIFGVVVGDMPDHGCKNIPLNIECYTDDRFICLGTGASGDMMHPSDTPFNQTVAQYFPAEIAVNPTTWTTVPHPDSCPIQDDARLIEKALASESIASIFGGGKASFRDLWEKNVEALTESWPAEDGGYDGSSADASLAQRLAFWTGGQCDRIDRLMRMSAMVRPKWDKHKSYMHRTICGAVARQTSWYSVGKPIEMTPVASVVDPVIRAGFQFLPITQVVDHFRGCVYVADAHRVFMPNGTMLKSEQFNALMGGFTFSLDDTGEKTTKKAFEAFTENQGVTFPKVDGSVFDPRHPSGAIIEEEGRRMVNTYVPVNVRKVPGDVTRFMTHLAKLLPNERDRQIALSYAAAIVQYPGHKFQWAPLFQGCEGNGKTLITRCVAYAVGQRYTHMPPASEISEKFNSWLFNTIFVGVEDIHVPDSKAEVLEILKPMITGDRLAKRAMQQDQVMMANCANFIFNSNHRNAIKKTLNDRRFCVFFTAQQQVEDIARDGMSGNYFPDLYDWLRGDGYAHVAHFLSTYAIPVEFNPTLGCQRAPYTSTTGEAVEASLGAVEQEVLECIEEGRQGFAGGWVSSMALDALIERLRMGRAIAPRKRRDLMKSIGYDWHPALKDGRVNNHILMDNGKPRLYIRQGHIHANLVGGAEVVRHYEAAQGDPVAIAALSQAVVG
jgi:hypothetical protein